MSKMAHMHTKLDKYLKVWKIGNCLFLSRINPIINFSFYQTHTQNVYGFMYSSMAKEGVFHHLYEHILIYNYIYFLMMWQNHLLIYV